VSRSKQTTVHRIYKPEPGCMESALELLLKKTICKTTAEQAPEPGRSDAAIVRHEEGVNHVDQVPNK
jgi:hypothetical protein